MDIACAENILAREKNELDKIKASKNINYKKISNYSQNYFYRIFKKKSFVENFRSIKLIF